MGGAQDSRGLGTALRTSTRVRGASSRASPEAARRRTGGAGSASGGEAVRCCVTHCLRCGEKARVGFDPGDGQVMGVAADCCEKAPDSLNEGLVPARLDGVVAEDRAQYSLSVRSLMRRRATVEEGPFKSQTHWRA